VTSSIVRRLTGADRFEELELHEYVPMPGAADEHVCDGGCPCDECERPKSSRVHAKIGRK
jgi:hypothetical protein